MAGRPYRRSTRSYQVELFDRLEVDGAAISYDPPEDVVAELEL